MLTESSSTILISPARCRSKNSKFLFLEVLSADPQNIDASVINLGPAVSEPYGFETVDIACMDGWTDALTDI